MCRLNDLPGLGWHEAGYVTLSASLARFADRLDDVLRTWAMSLGANAITVPDVISEGVLDRCGYLDSFPHMAMFAAHREDPTSAGSLTQGGCVLNPAACYHVYAGAEERTLDDLQLTTVQASCFRRESHYRPLERQLAFRMREIVVMGAAGDVRATLMSCREAIAGWCRAAGIESSFEAATDPFFLGERDPKLLMQRLGAMKTEVVTPHGLAIASINDHGGFFGKAFGIRCDDRAAHSGCVAFGIERWLAAFARQHGPDVDAWPLPAFAP